MLRRVASVLRWLLLIMGILIAAWMPFSFRYGASVHYGGSTPKAHLGVHDGAVTVWLEPSAASDGEWRAFFKRDWPSDVRGSEDPANAERAFVPIYKSGLRSTLLSIPLWLLAFLCLAWPVTSFIIHRRRHKRGFPVEPKGGGEAVSTSGSSS